MKRKSGGGGGFHADCALFVETAGVRRCTQISGLLPAGWREVYTDYDEITVRRQRDVGYRCERLPITHPVIMKYTNENGSCVTPITC